MTSGKPQGLCNGGLPVFQMQSWGSQGNLPPLVQSSPPAWEHSYRQPPSTAGFGAFGCRGHSWRQQGISCKDMLVGIRRAGLANLQAGLCQGAKETVGSTLERGLTFPRPPLPLFPWAPSLLPSGSHTSVGSLVSDPGRVLAYVPDLQSFPHCQLRG